MFKLNPSPTFALKVQISVPGQATPGVLELTARHKGRKELQAWQDLAKTVDGNDAAYLGEIIADWSVAGDDGQPVPYTEAAFAQLLNSYPTASFEIYDAYLKQLVEGRAKN